MLGLRLSLQLTTSPKWSILPRCDIARYFTVQTGEISRLPDFRRRPPVPLLSSPISSTQPDRRPPHRSLSSKLPTLPDTRSAPRRPSRSTPPPIRPHRRSWPSSPSKASPVLLSSRSPVCWPCSRGRCYAKPVVPADVSGRSIVFEKEEGGTRTRSDRV
jgi:hypothetical protein